MDLIGGLINLFLVMLIAPVLDGFARKVRARIHCRIGPPILQTWYDIIKLFKKKDIDAEVSSRLYLISPYLSLAFSLVAALIIPIGCKKPPLGFTGDVLLLVYLLASSSLLVAFGSTASGNPFSGIGAGRMLSLTVLGEGMLAGSIVTFSVIAGSLRIGSITELLSTSPRLAAAVALIPLAVFVYLESERVPFDIHEAEPEIVGILVEFSGRKLGLIKYSMMIRSTVLTTLLIDLAVPWWLADSYMIPFYIISIILWLLLLLLLTLIFTIVDSSLARYRISMAIEGLVPFLCISFLSIVLAFLGV
ncbi:MAG: respiratory chain complex I subunit 1 family protein [Candidatus Methanodesulfokora washburnensis]|jgi:formate hydrogenlyase subunit 4